MQLQASLFLLCGSASLRAILFRSDAAQCETIQRIGTRIASPQRKKPPVPKSARVALSQPTAREGRRTDSRSPRGDLPRPDGLPGEIDQAQDDAGDRGSGLFRELQAGILGIATLNLEVKTLFGGSHDSDQLVAVLLADQRQFVA